MAGSEEFVLPRQCLRDLNRWLRAARVRGAVIGGVASALLGTPRYTHDIDVVVVIDDAEWPEFIEPAARFGFEFRMSDAVAFARKNRVLLMRHRPSGVEVDISLGQLDFERDLIARSKRIKVEGILVPVAAPEDLIILKAIPRRPNDLADIDGLLHHHSRLDFRRITSEFAAFLELPGIMEDLERLLARHSKKKKR